MGINLSLDSGIRGYTGKECIKLSHLICLFSICRLSQHKMDSKHLWNTARSCREGKLRNLRYYSIKILEHSLLCRVFIGQRGCTAPSISHTCWPWLTPRWTSTSTATSSTGAGWGRCSIGRDKTPPPWQHRWETATIIRCRDYFW